MNANVSALVLMPMFFLPWAKKTECSAQLPNYKAHFKWNSETGENSIQAMLSIRFLPDLSTVLKANIVTCAPASQVQAEFNERADRWEKETAIHSAPGATYLHKDYMAVITKGTENPQGIIPLILKRLSLGSGDWFFALECITGQNPARDCENYAGALRAWDEWAKERAFINC